MHIQHFHDPKTGTMTYLVHDGAVGVVIDPIRDLELQSATVSWTASEVVADYIDRLEISIAYVIDSHVHADHLSGLPFFKERYGSRTVTGRGISEVRKGLGDPHECHLEEPFDVLVDDNTVLSAGKLRIEALSTPGHTPNHLSWKVGDAVFVGDTLFMPEYGTARCDFPGGSAVQLFNSIQRLYQLPEHTRLFVGHVYPSEGQMMEFSATVGEQKRNNIHISAETSKDSFVARRRSRDATLEPPHLFLPSVQVNVQAGELPTAAANGIAYLKIPVRTTDHEFLTPSVSENGFNAVGCCR